MKSLCFDNRFLNELPGDTQTENRVRQVQGACWSRVAPTPVAAPSLLAWSPEVAALLDLDPCDIHSPEFAQVFAGNALLPGMDSWASCYGGHQFGHWAGQLGDGRAISLGELINTKGQRYELQLKGAGPTPYSRHADGRAVLRSSLREFLCSEAMFHLGIPTTRALSLIGTGEPVVRDMFYDGHPRAEPGAVVCRVAPSFLRFGHFELLSSRGELTLLQQLVEFTMTRDFGLTIATAEQFPQQLAEWFTDICQRTAHLIVEWMRVGFVHGVMNTDNMSILGLTIDYGPYGWIDDFDPGWTPNTTDAEGKRYCFGNQAAIARWNLQRLAQALLPLCTDQQILINGIVQFDAYYAQAMQAMLCAKFGLQHWGETEQELVNRAFTLMQSTEVDMTEFFRALASPELSQGSVQSLRSAFYHDEEFALHQHNFAQWLHDYVAVIRRDVANGSCQDDQRVTQMNAVNPRYVLRNYLAQQAIDAAGQGDYSMIENLLNVLRTPYTEQTNAQQYSALRPEWARHKAGCSMLSCSS